MPVLTRPSADIEYILRSEFPGYVWANPQPVSRSGHFIAPRTPEQTQRRQELQQKIERRRQELLVMKLTAHNEFSSLLTSLRQKQAAEEEAERFYNKPHANADFDHWAKLDYWTIEEGVALCFGKSPKVVTRKSVEPTRELSPFAKRFMDTLEVAARARAMNQIQDSNLPGFFIAWARHMELPFPPELEALVAKRSPIVDWQAVCEQWKTNSQQWQTAHGEAKARIAELEQELAAARATPPTQWPWGSFDTAKLRRLADAAKRFWVNYDPAEPDTAPTNPQVAKWLEDQGESPNLAAAMATILRADELKPGRRRK